MQAVSYLHGHGIDAQCGAASVGLQPGIQVFVTNQSDAKRAKQLLSNVDLVKVFNSEFDLVGSQTPDLTRLPGYLAPPCPKCKKTLPLRNDITTCPACNTPCTAEDIADLVVHYHGPEKLLQCYPDDAVANAQYKFLECQCGYDLKGLPPRGKCPECGAQYEKRRAYEW